jgi:glycosyltransferase involved in cell wall biosynthesis
MPKVSVIIPIYNIENYIKQCLDCISNQTLKDIQIICVDDASEDNSCRIVEEYTNKDSRIILLKHKQNLGLSAARNTGLKNVNGEFVYFMDGDDLLEGDALEVCYNECKKNQLDILTFDADVFVDCNFSGDSLCELKDFNYDRKKLLQSNKIFSGESFFSFAVKNNAFKPSVCLSFINSKLLKINNLTFYPGIFYEDQVFTIQLYFLSNRIMYYPRKFFKRRIRDYSIMTNKIGYKNIHDILVISEEILKLCEKEEKKKNKKLLIQHVFSLLMWMEKLKDSIVDNAELEMVTIELKKNRIWRKYIIYKNMKFLNEKFSSFVKNITMVSLARKIFFFQLLFSLLY